MDRKFSAKDLALAFSQIQGKRSRMRKTHAGGRAPSCECGKCPKCLKREQMREYRKGKAK